MKIILCCEDAPLLERWKSAITEKSEEVYSFSTVQQGMELADTDSETIIILHNPLAETKNLQELKNRFPRSSLMVLSDNPNQADGVTYLRSGVVGYGNSYMARPRLASAVETIASGGVWVGQKVIRYLIKESSGGEQTELQEAGSPAFNKLSAREHEVAGMVAMGASNKEIAQQLDITERTVKAHLHSIYAKTGLSSRLPLALSIQKTTR